MDPQKILAKAEVLKRKSHHLSLDLRLRSLVETKKFLREQSIVLWNDKGEVPNLLDATLGRIANGRERAKGKAAENCFQLRNQVLQDPEFLDCRFFCKQETSLHEDLWPYATVLARWNHSEVKDSTKISKEARRILTLLEKDGPTGTSNLKTSLKVSGSAENRAFQRAKTELLNLLLVLESKENTGKDSATTLQVWNEGMPKGVRSKADHLSLKEAAAHLLSATIYSSIFTPEKRITQWFPWLTDDAKDLVESLIERKHVVRVIHRKTSYIIPKKVVTENRNSANL